ncbi:MAG: DUF4255 domain-containing protein [Bacteroidetes bacterium]|nr:DUF4255 domain-containing protein [Bacteroidota bacterium]
MIDVAFKFISSELNQYLNNKLSLDVASKDPVVLGNISKLSEAAANNDLEEKVILTLVNLEEERILRNPEKFTRVEDRLEQRNPKIFLNLYCLFAVNKSKYSEALKYLSFVIQFFQHRSVFNHITDPLLDDKIEKLLLELYTINFEQTNHLWGTMGGKYYPSALYKMRLITIDESFKEAEGEMITRVSIEGKGGLN